MSKVTRNRWISILGCEHEHLEIEVTPEWVEVWICGECARIDLDDFKDAIRFVDVPAVPVTRVVTNSLDWISGQPSKSAQMGPNP